MIDQYNDLNKKKVAFNMDFEEIVQLLVRQNYGTHRILSAIIHERRKLNYMPNPDVLADEIEKLLNQGHH
jgi:hypothetical protein